MARFLPRIPSRLLGGIGDMVASVANARGAVVLMYHSISSHELCPWISPRVRWPVQEFQRHMEFLRTHRQVVSMTQLGSMLAAGQTPPRGTVAITFDDGYLDTLRIAAPILDEAGLPATVYLPTWYIDRAKPQWVDELFGIFTSRRAQQLVTECGTWNLSNDHAARAAQVELNRVLLEASLDARERLLGQVRESLKPSGESPRLTMNWDEVRELVRRFPRIELGAHTVHHLDLRRWTGIEAEREISASAATIERETHVRPRHFSFPYGRRCEETRNMVQQAGFETAVGAGSKVLLGPASDRWALPRIEGHVSVPALKFLTSGAYTGLPWVV